MYDVVIIGAGVTGSAIARELSRYQYDTIVLDKNSDVCEGTSKANSGIVHAGFDNEPGSVMAKMNVSSLRRIWIFPLSATVLWCSALTRRIWVSWSIC